MRTTRGTFLGVLLSSLALAGCGGDAHSGDAGTSGPRIDAGAPSESCGSVRLTTYETAGEGGWCEYPTNLPMLPAFVREGFHAAIAEPWNGGSYDGDPGEGCGECWEIDSVNDTRVVMITNLCPVEGNPLCAGAHFHLDVAPAVSSALRAGFLDEGQARRVPCPVTGSVHLYVNDENVTYMRVAFVNHRVPIRTAEFRGIGDGVTEPNEWTPLRRSAGGWEVIGEGRQVDRGGQGVQFRITSAQGEVLVSETIVPGHPERRSTWDLGVQFEDRMPPMGGSCDFVPPGDVYVDGWGGIDQVRWLIDPWGEAEGGFFGETMNGCESGSCVEVARFAPSSGFHMRYGQAFPRETFSRIEARVRTRSGNARIGVAPSHEGTRCLRQVFDVGEEWSEVSIDLAGCDQPTLSAITMDSEGSPTFALLIDDVRYVR
ncbi:hypothetical protein [Sandaracinus amylolyticus]|uniref:hypothetical protein n=1 Tax=Sandaracinus amylolyticus TaxID=927083 RepID=UPI001F4794DA|nr:hypothetical protein [Sandaracinus amylolyticus]UJR87133.1 Hypothetical protein I5071_92340 [Sandaracinus amylolyticus]